MRASIIVGLLACVWPAAAAATNYPMTADHWDVQGNSGFETRDGRQVLRLGSEGGKPIGGGQANLKGAKLDTGVLKRQAAIISSMTQKERKTPDVIKASRKKRIAAGSGTTVQEVNRLLKQFDDMSTMMKRMNKLGQKGLMRQGMSALMPKGMQQGRRPF